MQREKSTRFAPLFHATPVSSGSILLGKLAALLVIVLIMFLIVFLSGSAAILYDGKASITLTPFILIWGVLLIPTFVFWIASIMYAFTLLKSRYAVYAAGIGLLLLSGYAQYKQYMNWVFNWNLWYAVNWSDISVFELDRIAVILNRLLIVSMSVLLLRAAVASFHRYDRDPLRAIQDLRPRIVVRSLFRWLPWMATPLTIGIILAVMVSKGVGGGTAEKQAKDYWRKNVATWTDSLPLT